MKSMIAKRMGRMESSGIRKIFDLAANLKDPCNLSIGQPDFDTPDEVKKEAIHWIEQGFNKYTQTQGIKELRDAVVTRFKEKNNIITDSERVLITSGVMGGFYLACCVLIDPGDEVIIPDPYFVAYKHMVSIQGGKPVFVDTYPDFHPKAADIKKAITEKTKAIIINSPTNPTGQVYPKRVIKKITEIAERNEIMIISDEIYEPFIYDGEHESPGSLYDNVLTLNGFSKTASITGWRIGYATGPQEVMNEMKKLQQYSFVCASSFAQKTMAKHINLDISHHIDRYNARRDMLYDELSEQFEIAKPEGAFYMFPKVPWGTGSEFVAEAIKNNLLIIPGGVFSEKDTHFRISFAAPDEQVKKGIGILKKLAESN